MGNVRLWDLAGAALIKPCKSGVIFTNQVNGVACGHSECEGILIPLNTDSQVEGFASVLQARLCGLFDGAWDAVDKGKADEIDGILSEFPQTEGISVDRTKLQYSVESWVFVVAQETKESCYSGFGVIKGILTWENSD